MRKKIKMLKMCEMVLCFDQVHICSSDSSSANLTLIPLNMTLTMICGCEIRLVILYETQISFLDSDVAILSIKLFTTLTRFSF